MGFSADSKNALLSGAGALSVLLALVLGKVYHPEALRPFSPWVDLVTLAFSTYLAFSCISYAYNLANVGNANTERDTTRKIKEYNQVW